MESNEAKQQTIRCGKIRLAFQGLSSVFGNKHDTCGCRHAQCLTCGGELAAGGIDFENHHAIGFLVPDKQVLPGGVGREMARCEA
jgi:hypothetical protein